MDAKDQTTNQGSAAGEKNRSGSGQQPLFQNLNTLKRGTDNDRAAERRASLKDQSEPQGMLGQAWSKLMKPEGQK